MTDCELRIDHLTPAKIPQAFPLIQLAVPGLSLEDWSDLAMRHMAASAGLDGGFLTVEDRRNVIHGLLQYLLDGEQPVNRTLLVRNMVAFHLFEPCRRQVSTMLIEAMERLAQRHHCAHIETLTPNPDFGQRQFRDVELLEAAGYEREDLRFCKHLPIAV